MFIVMFRTVIINADLSAAFQIEYLSCYDERGRIFIPLATRSSCFSCIIASSYGRSFIQA